MAAFKVIYGPVQPLTRCSVSKPNKLTTSPELTSANPTLACFGGAGEGVDVGSVSPNT